MIIIKFIRNIMSIFIICLLSSCDNSNIIVNYNRRDIIDNYKCIDLQVKEITNYMNENKILLNKKSGVLGYKQLSAESFENIELYNEEFIDPFAVGDFKIEINNWKMPGEDFISNNKIMIGGPLKYDLINNDNIMLLFSGPDQDIDNKDLNVVVLDSNYFSPEISYKTEVVLYDPTNGIKSNGDIVLFLIRKSNLSTIYWYYATDDPVFQERKMRRTWEGGGWSFN